MFFPLSCPAFLQQGFSGCPHFLLMISLWWKQNNMHNSRPKADERNNDENNPLDGQLHPG